MACDMYDAIEVRNRWIEISNTDNMAFTLFVFLSN